jgi:hypothetical protein
MGSGGCIGRQKPIEAAYVMGLWCSSSRRPAGVELWVLYTLDAFSPVIFWWRQTGANQLE